MNHIRRDIEYLQKVSMTVVSDLNLIRSILYGKDRVEEKEDDDEISEPDCEPETAGRDIFDRLADDDYARREKAM